jgi:FAD/FMN-containing dehydrogenase/Fe-S oxidoreductase
VEPDETVADGGLGAFAELLAESHPTLFVDDSDLTRSQYAFDASTYRVMPLAVVQPRSAEDVAAVLRAAHETGVPVTVRGSGTSMAGNAVGRGVIMDLARHLTKIHEVDAERQTATVDAGVVLDTLQGAARPYGLMFGPDPSSHSRVTIGGMIGNDACGNHSVAHGRTSDHVVELEIVLADGTRARATRGGLRAIHSSDQPRVAATESALRELTAKNLGLFRTGLGQISRQVSGYHLHRLLPENQFDVARALAGSEGSLAVVTRAVVKLTRSPRAVRMLVVGYDDLVDAAEDVPTILTFRPIAVEATDQAIVSAMRQRSRVPQPDFPTGHAWLYVELEDDDSRDEDRIETMVKRLRANGRVRGVREARTQQDRDLLWRIREDGAGLVANPVEGRRAWPGWEDAAVHPDRLAAYLTDFRTLMAEYGLEGVLYGHFGAGCVHVRINFDHSSAQGRKQASDFLHAAARLVARHGGSVSGEHGDGRARSSLLAVMYGPDMLAAFAEVKDTFDPGGLLNPGIIVRPVDVTRDLAPVATTPSPTTLLLHDDGHDLATAASRCVGIGRCVAPTGGVMCPSYRATRNERDSTRGRARALQDLMSGQPGVSEEAVLDTLDLCLSCKACATDCPTGVDMASYKSEVLYRRYHRRLRPRSHYSLGWLPTLTRLASPAAALLNMLSASRLARHLLPLLGITTERAVPQLSTPCERKLALDVPRSEEPRAVLLVDTFSWAFRPDIVTAAVRVLADAGVPVALSPRVCCGLTWTTTGQLDRARRTMQRAVTRLASGPDASLPIVTLEPSCAAAFVSAHELVDSADARAVASRILTFEAALRDLARPGWRPPALPRAGVVQTHCHERSVLSASTQAATLRGAGMTDVTEAIGCCGLAGNFGFEAAHYSTSVAVAETSLLPAIRSAPSDAVLIADGFSCRTQIDHIAHDGRRARHLAEVMNDALPVPVDTPHRKAPR